MGELTVFEDVNVAASEGREGGFRDVAQLIVFEDGVEVVIDSGERKEAFHIGHAGHDLRKNLIWRSVESRLGLVVRLHLLSALVWEKLQILTGMRNAMLPVFAVIFVFCGGCVLGVRNNVSPGVLM